MKTKTEVIEQARDLRRRLTFIGEEVRRYQKDHLTDGEAIANATLSFRHIEDATMRLGKVIQALDGGVSCYEAMALSPAAPAPLKVKVGDRVKIISSADELVRYAGLPRESALLVAGKEFTVTGVDASCFLIYEPTKGHNWSLLHKRGLVLPTATTPKRAPFSPGDELIVTSDWNALVSMDYLPEHIAKKIAGLACKVIRAITTGDSPEAVDVDVRFSDGNVYCLSALNVSLASAAYKPGDLIVLPSGLVTSVKECNASVVKYAHPVGGATCASCLTYVKPYVEPKIEPAQCVKINATKHQLLEIGFPNGAAERFLDRECQAVTEPAPPDCNGVRWVTVADPDITARFWSVPIQYLIPTN